MSKVKLLSNLQAENGTYTEGSVIDLPDDQAEHLIKLGAAEPSDDAVTAALTEKPATAEAPKAEGVEPAADPLANTQAAGEQTPSVENPATPAQPTPEAQPSLSTNLHLG